MKAWGFIVAALVMGSAQAKTPLTIEHLNKLNNIYQVTLSADGRYLVYGQKNGGLQPADNTSDLYLVDLAEGNKVKRLTESDSMEHSVRFSADGSSLYFLTDRSGSTQLWQLPLTGGEARQVTDLPLDVQGYLLSADEKKLVLTLDVVPGCKDLACTVDLDKCTFF